MSCPICGGDTLLLGTLGYFDYYRCRYCGTTGYRAVKAEKTTRLQAQLARRRERLRARKGDEDAVETIG